MHDHISSGKSKKTLPPNLSLYKGVYNELYIEDKVIMRAERVVMPVSLRNALLKEAHRGHPGSTRMKRKLRKTYWWPKMDLETENIVRTCMACEMSEKSTPRFPGQETPIPKPTKPWSKVAIDISGPFYTAPNSYKYAIVLIDYQSSFPEIMWSKEATTNTIIQWLEEIFARFGNPSQLISDNGPHFNFE